MAHRFIDIKVPYGMAIQLHADGIYRILLNETDLVKLRDWAADFTNQLTKDTLEYLERRKVEEKIKSDERQQRVKRIPLDKTDEIVQTEKRISVQPFEAMAPTLPAQPKTALVENPPNRIVNTNQGRLEVAFDVTDKELNELGYILVPYENVPADPPKQDFDTENTEAI